MKFDVVHKGVVCGVGERMVAVTIETDGACGSCKVKSLCGIGEQREITVYDTEAWKYSEGEEVIVGVGSALAIKAVLLAYVVPFLLMLATLLVVRECGFTELVQGLATLGAVAVYYVVLWFFRGRLERDIIFKIRKAE